MHSKLIWKLTKLWGPFQVSKIACFSHISIKQSPYLRILIHYVSINEPFQFCLHGWLKIDAVTIKAIISFVEIQVNQSSALLEEIQLDIDDKELMDFLDEK